MSEVNLEERVRRLEAAVGEAQAFGAVALAVAEQAIGHAVADRDDSITALNEIHTRARQRIAPLAAQPHNRAIANKMFAVLEAVMLHAAQTGRQAN
jgi:hypothetical protein